jgi:S1-C subfamily serine protease
MSDKANRFHTLRPQVLGLCLCGLLALAAPVEPQDAGDALSQVLKAEKQRVELIERLSRTVIAIFPAVPEGQGRQDAVQGSGSGVIIDADGHALTNYHVVRGTEKVNVGLSNGRVYPATVKGRDVTGDIAVIKIEGNGFSFAESGDSDALQVGDWVLAMGNPFGLATDFSPTVTQGIVSGLHRYLPGTIDGDLTYTDCIQIDAPINPGSSGGPLFDAQGKLVGINGRVRGRQSLRPINSGVGFAVPINQVREFLPDLLVGRDVHHAVLGVELSERQEDVAIKRVVAGSAAETLGLQVGDVVRSFQGRDIRSKTELMNRIGILPAGKRVRMVIERKGARQEMEAVLGERPTSPERAQAPPKPPPAPPPAKPPVQPAAQPSELTPDGIARRFVETVGGYEALSEIKNSVSTGRIRTLTAGNVWLSGRLTQYEIGPSRFRSEIVLERRGSTVRNVVAFDGNAGWVYTNGGLRDMTAEETETTKAEIEAIQRFETPDGLKDAKAEYAGTETLEGRTVHTVITKDGNIEHRWSFDSETWLLVRRVRGTPKSGELRDHRISDYRRVGKVLQPFLYERYIGGTRTESIQVEGIEFNRGLDEAALLEKPTAEIGPEVY